MRRIDCVIAFFLLLLFSGCGVGVMPIKRQFECPVVSVRSEGCRQVVAMKFESMSRHIHVDSTLYLADINVLPQLKLFDCNGSTLFNDSCCKVVGKGRRIIDSWEQKCKIESLMSEGEDQSVCVTFYFRNKIPESYLIRFSFYQRLIAEVNASTDNNITIGDCHKIEWPSECRLLSDLKDIHSSLAEVPVAAVLLSAYADTVFSPSCFFYKGDFNPVGSSDRAFFRLWMESEKIADDITISQFKCVVENKMLKYVKLYSSNTSWEFRLVCWH